MKPYYEQDGITIYHGDCREILPTLGPVDVLVTDPPYGIGMLAFDDDFMAGVEGVNLSLATRGAVFHSPRRVMEFAALMDRWRIERLLWMHKTADIAAPWRGWCMNGEAILILSTDRSGWPEPETYRSDTYSVGPWERAGHPNGKPIEVVRDLVARLGGETILDPFMGSGTTLRAAKDLGRKAIGIELEEKWCEVAAKRMSQSVLPLYEGWADNGWMVKSGYVEEK